MASEWQERTLGELVAVHRQQVNPAAHPDKIFHHYSIPSYDAGLGPSVESGRSILSNKFLVTSDAVLVSKLNPRIPRVWTPNVIVDGLAIASTEFLVLRPQKWVDRRFLHFLLLSPAVRDELVACATGTSGSHQRVPPEQLLSLQVRIPPLAEQRAVAHILGTLDDKIELNRRMARTLEEMARALFKAWFVDFEPVRAKMDGRWRPGESLPGLPAHLYDLFPDRLVDSELGPIPAGWEVKSLDQIGTFLNGLALQKYPPTGDGRFLPVIKIAQLRAGSTRGADRASADLKPAYVVNDGDILFSWSGSLECVYWAGGPGALNQHLFKVTPNGYPKWLCYLAIHMHLDEFRHIAAGKATTMGHIQRHHLSDAKMAVPPDNLLRVLDAVFEALLEETWHLNVASRTCACLRDTLLPKLVSGEIRLSAPERLLAEVW